MPADTLQLTIEGSLGGLLFVQSAILLYQYKKLSRYKNMTRVLQEELENTKKIDEVTGAWNYAFFVKAANLVIKNARRQRDPVTMILIDIDQLEKINLRHSFNAGNAVLKHLHRKVKSIVGEYAVIGRFGGSGLFVLLARCDEEKALQKLEILRMELANDACKLSSRKSIPYEVSMSAVTMYGKQITLGTMLDTVEESLEKVKANRKTYALADRNGHITKVA